jgi:AcrR family transcriptional regulator
MLEHAAGEFARRGLKGATTDAIAVRCGVSQPYLFRLSGSKGALFLAAPEYGFDLAEAGMPRRAEAGSVPARPQLMQSHDGELAKLFLQGCAAACDDEQVADLLRRRLRRLATRCGRPEEDLLTELLAAAGGLALREDQRAPACSYPSAPPATGSLPAQALAGPAAPGQLKDFTTRSAAAKGSAV